MPQPIEFRIRGLGLRGWLMILVSVAVALAIVVAIAVVAVGVFLSCCPCWPSWLPSIICLGGRNFAREISRASGP